MYFTLVKSNCSVKRTISKLKKVKNKYEQENLITLMKTIHKLKYFN